MEEREEAPAVTTMFSSPPPDVTESHILSQLMDTPDGRFFISKARYDQNALYDLEAPFEMVGCCLMTTGNCGKIVIPRHPSCLHSKIQPSNPTSTSGHLAYSILRLEAFTSCPTFMKMITQKNKNALERTRQVDLYLLTKQIKEASSEQFIHDAGLLQIVQPTHSSWPPADAPELQGTNSAYTEIRLALEVAQKKLANSNSNSCKNDNGEQAHSSKRQRMTGEINHTPTD